MNPEHSRREFLKITIVPGAITTIAGSGLLAGCENDSEKKISPPDTIKKFRK